ncbi:MAG: hypothetical protein ACRYFS_11390 [Janthinobacterium lividum]
MAQDWRTAYFRQAQSDYDTLQLLERNDAALCHQLHYLQMATEKLAKGYATVSGGPPPPKVHRGFVQFMRQIKRRPELQILCQCTPRQVIPYIDSLLPYARRIEDLAPANANDGPNSEYPWRGRDSIIAPVEYDFANLQFNIRGMINMLKFLERCFQII